MIGIVNYGLGNLSSVVNAFSFLGEEARLLSQPDELAKADALVLPGVGHFAHGMEHLRKGGLEDALNEQVLDRGKPTLGICLGMQLMCRASDEAPGVSGLGWFDLDFHLLKSTELKTPNIGWNSVVQHGEPRLFDGIVNPTFYFVHSYFVDGDGEGVSSYIDADVRVGASLERGNIFATQFHPEKSQQDGLKLLATFIRMVRNG